VAQAAAKYPQRKMALCWRLFENRGKMASAKSASKLSGAAKKKIKLRYSQALYLASEMLKRRQRGISKRKAAAPKAKNMKKGGLFRDDINLIFGVREMT